MLKLTFRSNIFLTGLKPVKLENSSALCGILMHVQKVKLCRKVWFFHFYEVETDLFLFKPKQNILSRDYTEDTFDKGYSSVWLEINNWFENFIDFQYQLRIVNLFDPTTEEYTKFNKIKKEFKC